jgi:glycosidase
MNFILPRYLSRRTNYYDMHWDLLNHERNQRLFNIFKQLFDLRRTNTSLRHGTIEFFHEDSDNSVLAFNRNKDIFIICHFSSQIA